MADRNTQKLVFRISILNFKPVWLVLLICLCFRGYAQDTAAQTSLLEKLRAVGREEAVNSIEKFRSGRIGIRQEKLLHDIRQTSERAKIFLKKGLDTTRIQHDLTQVAEQLELIRSGIFHSHETVFSTRNLTVSASVLNDLQLRMQERRTSLEAYVKSLVDYVDRIDSLSADSALYTFPFDSAYTIRYYKKMAVVAKELGPVDTALRRSVGAMHELEAEVDLLAYRIRSNLEDIEQLRKAQVSKTFDQELPHLWEPAGTNSNVADIVRLSVKKEKLALTYYFRDARGRLVILLVLFLAAWYFLHSLKKKWIDEKGAEPDYRQNLVLRYPALSSVIIVLNIFQFIFLQPPFIFSYCIWLVSAICLCVVFNGYITGFWMRYWMAMVGFFVLAGLTNMVLQPSQAERWWMLLLSVSSAAYCLYVLRSSRRHELREKKILYFIAFVMIVEVAAAAFNITGRYNLSKTLLVSGFSGLVIAILFLWTVRLINEGLGLISNVYKKPDRKLFYIDFDRVGEKVPGVFYLLLVTGWFILVGRNFYAFQEAASPFNDFLNTERTLGDYTFTINSLFVFVVIIAVATILSQIISFFASDPPDLQRKDKQARRPGVGSWLLLIRIFILSVGVFLAFAAAGIPLDKLAIVLGALGIGIGLGLQGLVSNLVSGLIIAFEKPVNVGDFIEVNGKLGTMKAIGFRSSVVNLVDGACLIIPNGDLLSHHLVNWTMGNNRRRVNVVVSVAYGTNLRKAKELLEELLKNHQRIIQFPEPLVTIKGFEESSVDFELFFWAAHIREFYPLRTEIIAEIDEAFRRAGIIIPFPQQDVHIINPKDLPGTPEE